MNIVVAPVIQRRLVGSLLPRPSKFQNSIQSSSRPGLPAAHTVSSAGSASTGTFTPQPLPHSRELVTISKEELESIRRLMAQLEGPTTTSTSTFAHSGTPLHQPTMPLSLPPVHPGSLIQELII